MPTQHFLLKGHLQQPEEARDKVDINTTEIKY